MFHRSLGSDLAAAPDDGSRLRYTFKLIRQRQTAVKLHGVFAFRWKVLDCAPVRQFHRPPRGDSRALVGPSCKSPIKRQGITLTAVTSRDLVHEGSGGPRFLVTSSRRREGRTVSSPLLVVFGVQSLRILDAILFRRRFINNAICATFTRPDSLR